MRQINFLRNVFIVCLISFSQAVFAGEFDNQCTLGLALEKHVDTDCSTNVVIAGKTYCFGNEKAKQIFLEDTKGNIAKAENFYSKTK